MAPSLPQKSIENRLQEDFDQEAPLQTSKISHKASTQGPKVGPGPDFDRFLLVYFLLILDRLLIVIAGSAALAVRPLK